MAIGDVYQGVIHSTYQSNPNVFCIFCQVLSEVNESLHMSDITSYLENSYVPELQPLQNTGVTMKCTTAKQIWPNTSIEHVEPLDPVVIGTRVSTVHLPGQLSAVTQLVSDVASPTSRNRGRDFLFGAAETDITATEGNWTDPYLQAIRDMYVTLGNQHLAASGNEYYIGVFSRTQADENADPQYVSNGGVVPDPPTFGDPNFLPLQMVRSNPLVRTQRRRQPEDPCAVYSSAEIDAA